MRFVLSLFLFGVSLLSFACSSPGTSELDKDGDGVLDADDAFPENPYENSDMDKDGIGDNADPFPEIAGCPIGYDDVYNDGSACQDRNECVLGTSQCHANATCSNTAGDYSCLCHPGFIGDGKICIDTDECESASDNCDANAVCINSPGAFSCECAPGYDGDGVSCADTNECATANGGCHQRCNNTPGAFHCSCDPGFSLGDDGTTCIDLDECAQDNGGCEQTCVNSPGDYTCSCTSGYELEDNGKDCLDIDGCEGNRCSDNGDLESECADVPAPGNGNSCTCSNFYTNIDGVCSPGKSCAQIRAQYPDAPSGVYPIDPDGPGGSPPFDVVCQMTEDGGGWTRVLHYVNSGYAISQGEVGDLSNPLADAKLSDAQINGIRTLSTTGYADYRIKGNRTSNYAYLVSNGSYNDLLAGWGFAVPAFYDVKMCTATTIVGCTKVSSLDPNLPWLDGLHNGSAGNGCDRYFTGHEVNGTPRHCYKPNSTSQRCVSVGENCGSITYEANDSIVLWIREQ